MGDYNKRDYLERRKSALINERQSFIPHYRELAEFIQPRRGRFFVSDRNKGDRRFASIINSKATQAHRVARSGMLAGTMSPTQPWFSLETPDSALMEFMPVKEWLYKVEALLRRIYNQSNFYNMAPVMLGELLLFGTGCMSQVDDFEDVARFYTHTAGSYMIGQNARYDVNTVIREFEWSVEQIVGQFGYKNCSMAVKTAYDRGTYDSWFPVTHYTGPNGDYDESKGDSRYKGVKSCYYEPGNVDKDAYLEEKGFDEFPYYCPRWDVTGEDIYGTDCPAMTALGDIKGLQIEEKRKAQAIDKMVNPPLSGPASLKSVPVSGLPGGLTAYDSNGTQKLEPIYTVNANLGELRLDIGAVERRIETAFYNDLFLAITQMEGIQPKNQLDIMQRHQERLLQLGPVLERLHGEFLNKMITRTFNQCARAGILPIPPPELQGQTLEVKYISSLAMAQKAVATQAIEKMALYVGGLVGAGKTDAWDKFDGDQSIDEYAQILGVPPRIIVSDDQVQAIREQRAQQQQAQMALAAAQQAADVAQSASKADMSGDNALTAMTGKSK